ncbi:hypothetical protein IL306_010976 [Fusarium sp. DS 682]|nr:hypothetical protein IL306_010976 [Fusarium sp. DS 682]
MPKWVFHHTAGTFSPEDKRQIAQGMTKIYSSVGLPPFYSNTHFIEPIMKPKGIKWEMAIYEGDIEYWRINGIRPPAQGSALEKKWFDANQITDEEELFRTQERP